MPLAWTSRIEVWEPNHRFVDRQIAAPYLWWRHEHRFETAAGATRVIDEVEYLPRTAWMTARVVRRDVERSFRDRQDALDQVSIARPAGRHDATDNRGVGRQCERLSRLRPRLGSAE